MPSCHNRLKLRLNGCIFSGHVRSLAALRILWRRRELRSPTVGAGEGCEAITNRWRLSAYKRGTCSREFAFFCISSFFCAKRCASSFYISRFFIRKKIAPKWTHSYIVPSIFKIYCDECTILCFGAMQHCELGYSHTSGCDMCGILEKYCSCSQDSSNLSLGIAPS